MAAMNNTATRGFESRHIGPQGAAKLVSDNIREVTNRLKRLPDVMDRFEAFMEHELEEAPPPPKKPFAPWWGWFGLAVALAGLAVWAFK